MDKCSKIIEYIKAIIQKYVFFKLGYSLQSTKTLDRQEGILSFTNSGHYLLTHPKDNVVGGLIRKSGSWAAEESSLFKKICISYQNNQDGGGGIINCWIACRKLGFRIF